MHDPTSRLQTSDHGEAGLVPVEPGQEGDPGLVVEGGRLEDVARERQRRGHRGVVRREVALVEGSQPRRGGRGDRRERTEERVGVVGPVAADQLGVVEVVAGVEPHAGRQRGPEPGLVVRGEQGDLHPVDLGGVLAHEVEEGRGGCGDVGTAPVAAQLGVERLTQPVQDHGLAHLLEQTAVDPEVVLGAPGDTGQVTRCHHDDLRTGGLDEGDLLCVGGKDLVEGAQRPGSGLVGASTRGNPGSVGLRLLGAAAHQLLDRVPVQAHVALGGVHGLGHAEAVTEQLPPEGQGRLPVDSGRSAGHVVTQRVGGDVRGGEGHPARVGLWVLDPGTGLGEPDLAPGPVRAGKRKVPGDRRSAHEVRVSTSTRRPSAEERRPASTSSSPRTADMKS